MPEQVRCPSCQSALRVPDSLLGKNVKCPKCSTTFLAEQDAPERPQSGRSRSTPADEDEAPRRRRPAREEEEEEEEEPIRSQRRPSSREENDDDEEEERPRRRRKRRSADAESAVAAPAIALLVLGIVGILVGLANVIYFLTGRGLGVNPSTAYIVGSAVGALVSVLWAGIIVSGALHMKGLRNYGSAMAACIIAMIPCNLCCFLGIPLGIWGLVVLNNPDVKRAFS